MSMFKNSNRRPSAGVIIGIVALVLAIAGSAIAGSNVHQKINKGQVKKIATNQINKLAPDLDVKSAETADTAKTSDTAKIASNVLSANVSAFGSVIGSIPAGATSNRTALGTYKVSFGRSIGDCTISASAANITDAAPEIALVAVSMENDTTLLVFTRTGANVPADEPFYVQAICPG